jgi:hypothetical protein
MKTLRWLSALALLLPLALVAALPEPAAGQGKEVKEVAELLPAQALFCVEVRQPDKLAREVEALLKGSAIDDLPVTMARFRAKLKDNENYFGLFGVGELALLLSPEVLRDAAKVRGAAFAVTGINKDGPEYVAVVLTGESNIPRLIVRGNLSFNQMFIVGEVAGVPIFREKSRDFSKVPAFREKGAPPPEPPIQERGPAIAMTPGMFVFGSNKDLVKDVLLRARRKSTEQPLAGMSAYKEAAKLRDKPGLFFYADPAALEAQMDRLAAAPGGVPAFWKQLKAAVPPKAVRNATAMLTLQGGNLHLQARINLAPKAKSALLDLLPDRKADPQLLAFAPRGSMLTTIAGLGDGPNKWEALLKLLDVVAKASGPGRSPGDDLRGLDDKIKLKLGKDVLGRVSSVGVVLDLEKGKEPRTPMLLVRATNADAATFLADRALPKLLALAGEGAEPKKSAATVLGQSITTFDGALLAGWKAVHVGRSGPVLLLGPDKTRVAESLVGAAKKEGTLTEPRVAAALKGADAPVGVGVASLGPPLVAAFQEAMMPPVRVVFKDKNGGPPPKVEPVKPPPYVEKGAQEMAKASATLAPLVFTLERKPDALLLEARQPALRGTSTRMINVWVDTMLQRAVYRPPFELKELDFKK